MTCTENNPNGTISIPSIRYWHIISISFLLFSIAYSIESYSTLTPKFSVVIPTFIFAFLITAEAKNINIRKFPKAVSRIGMKLPLIILSCGTIIGLYKVSDSYLEYFLGDFYLIAQFVILGLIFSLKGIKKRADKIFWSFFIAQIIVYLSSFYFTYTKYFSDINRFAPPDILFVITSAWFAFYHGKTIALVILIVLMTLSALSGMRFSFCVSVLILFLVFVGSRKRILSSNRVGFRILVTILILLMGFNFSKIAGLKTINRILGTFQGKEYELASVYSHFQEAKIVILEQMDNPFINVFFGNGHGALYKKYVCADLEVNLTPKGTHNIHVSPVLFFFRYGLVGLAWYFALLLYALKKTKKMLFLRKPALVDNHEAISVFYLLSLLIASFMGNSFIYLNIPVAFYLTANSK